MGRAYDLDELDEGWGPLLQQLDDLLMQARWPAGFTWCRVCCLYLIDRLTLVTQAHAGMLTWAFRGYSGTPSA